MKTNTLLSTAVAALLVSGPAMAGFINFEDAPTRSLSGTSNFLVDNDPITTEYQSTDGVSFIGAFLEKTGQEDVSPHGFKTNQTGLYDDPLESGLGSWFLRTGGEVTSEERGGTGTYLSILFDNPTLAAGGEIWDIDGDNAQRSEQWRIDAFLGDATEASASILSPEGTTTGPDSLDGKAWKFAFSGVEFDRLDFVFTGNKLSGVGLGFDNFSTTTVPEPGTLALLGLGVCGLVLSRRRRFDS